MKPYIPATLPLNNLDYKRLLPLIGKSNAAIGQYDGLLLGIPNPAVMLSPLTTKEATLSSKIEGTQVTVNEVFEHEAGMFKEGEKSADIQEITNYRQALYMAYKALDTYPIKLGFIRELHKALLDSARGHDKNPGEFRKDQNWIGRPSCAIEEASFIPPTPLRLLDFLQEWERYVNSSDVDPLLQAAVVHAQFELIHPFKDGNGRIGRIIIPLFLYTKRALSQPMFYLSEYLEKHREEYYQRLLDISSKDDWNGWIAFFLEAVANQATQNSERVKAIRALYDEMKVAIQATTHSQYSVHILDSIFSKPVFGASDIVRELTKSYDVHAKTARSLLRKLKEAEILKEIKRGSGSRSAIMYFPRLISIIE
jgi:Fic family protein